MGTLLAEAKKFLIAVASRVINSVLMTVFVPNYRCGAVLDFH